jgi:hypothetical protein
MPGIMKGAKMKAIMDIISQMDDMELSRLMPKDKMDMESMDEEMMKPEKKGITIMKLESSRKPKLEIEEEDEGEDMEDEDEEIDPLSSLARLKERLKKGRM